MDPQTYRDTKVELQNSIRIAKFSFRDNIEDKFDSKDSKVLWSNLKLGTQYKGPSKSVVSNDASLPDKLNDFYARFDKDNNSIAGPAPCNDDQFPFIKGEDEVHRNLSLLKKSKLPGLMDLHPN